MKTELTKSPQKFNTFVGFDVATTVDDASRNAALISNAAAVEVLKQITSHSVAPKTDSLVTLMQNANANGTLLYTISENAAALYRRFLQWQEQTLTESSTRNSDSGTDSVFAPVTRSAVSGRRAASASRAPRAWEIARISSQ